MNKYVILLFITLGYVTAWNGIPNNYPLFTSLFPILFALPCIFSLIKLDQIKGSVLFLILCIFSLFIETVALKTGIPYGFFTYSDMFSYTIYGTPIIVPFGWIPLCVGAYFFAQHTSKNNVSLFFFFLLFLLGADAIVDPGAVALSLWEYTNKGIYYNVPFSNFLGWVISGTIGYIFINKLFKVPLTERAFGSNYLYLIFYWTGVCLERKLFIPVVIGVLVGIYGYTMIKQFTVQK